MVALDSPRRGRPRRAAVERHPLGTGRGRPDRRARRPQAWADAVGSVPVASLTVTKLRWLRDAEPDERRARRRRRPPPRLAHLAPVAAPSASTRSSPTGRTPPAPATGPRRPRTTGTTCSSWPSATTRSSPACSARPRRARATSAARCSAPVPATTPPRPSRSTCSPATSPSPSAPPASSRRSRQRADRRRLRPGHRVRRRHRRASCRSRARSTPPGCSTPPRACSASTTRGLSALALSAPAGADGLVLVPYLEGERTPNKPDATGALHGLRLANTTPAHLARAAVEGMLCALADGIDALRAQGVAGRAAVPHRRRRAVRRRAGDRAVGARARRPRPDARRVRGRRRRPAGRVGALRVGDGAVVELGRRGDRVHRRPGRRRSASSTPRSAS